MISIIDIGAAGSRIRHFTLPKYRAAPAIGPGQRQSHAAFVLQTLLASARQLSQYQLSPLLMPPPHARGRRRTNAELLRARAPTTRHQSIRFPNLSLAINTTIGQSSRRRVAEMSRIEGRVEAMRPRRTRADTADAASVIIPPANYYVRHLFTRSEAAMHTSLSTAYA